MEIGKVTEQVNAEHFYFGKPMGTGGPILPGDYVQVGDAKGGQIAIVEGVTGKLTKTRVKLDQDYVYSCRLLGHDSNSELLGSSVFLPDMSMLTRRLNDSIAFPLEVGELARYFEPVPFSISGARLIGTHSCFFGSSGSGKTTLLGLLLEEILLNIADIQVIVFDLNSDFSFFNQPRAETEVNTGPNRCIPIPPVVLRAQQEMLATLPATLIHSPTMRISRFPPEIFLAALGGSPYPSDELLIRNVFTSLTHLDIPITVPACLEVVTQLLSGSTGVAQQIKGSLTSKEIHNAALRSQAKLLRVAASPLWSSGTNDSLEILTKDLRPAFVQFNLGRMPFSDRALFTEAALSLLWGRNESQKRPTLIVIDEAHNVAPSAPETSQRRTLEWVNRISGEGRKYGLFLIVVSQRPAKIHSNTLDNCSNYFLLRLQNQDDLESLSRRSQEISQSLLSRVVAFRHHEALIFGTVSNPAIVRVGRRRMR